MKYKFRVRCTKSADSRFVVGKIYGIDEGGRIFDERGRSSAFNSTDSFDDWYTDCNWCDYDFELVPADRYELHITCNDGVTTNAVYKENGKIVKRAKAVCAPSDEFSFGEGARLAFNRAVYGTDYCPSEVALKAEDKPTSKYKVGDLAKVVDNTCSHRFPLGEIVRIISTGSATGTNAEYLDGHDWWGVVFTDLEPYTEPEQEPMKLYCVKDYYGELVKGKIYEFDGHQVNYEKIECFYAKDFEDWKCGDPSFAACLVPLVKREAQAGEWIYATNKDGLDGYEIGQIMQVSKRFDCGGGLYAYVEGDSEEHQLFDEEYLVLDGYAPEPEYYNGEVVCVDNGLIFTLTVGKVYEVKDGFFTNDAGCINPLRTGPLKSLEDLNTRHAAKFIEFKGEQS